jgi:hypothetical protein
MSEREVLALGGVGCLDVASLCLCVCVCFCLFFRFVLGLREVLVSVVGAKRGAWN